MEFSWTFFSRTLFFSHFWWNEKENIFDIFSKSLKENCGLMENGIVSNDCYECYWRVQEDGFYFGPPLSPVQAFAKLHDWKFTNPLFWGYCLSCSRNWIFFCKFTDFITHLRYMQLKCKYPRMKCQPSDIFDWSCGLSKAKL